MSALLDLSARIIDTGVRDEPVNRITQELSEVDSGIAVIESFSHCVAFRTDEGLVLFDAGSSGTGAEVLAALRGWSDAPIHSLIYTHGHVDHVGGSAAVLADARTRGEPAPRVIAQENVPQRFARYRCTAGYNMVINRRQFGWLLGGKDQTDGSGELRPPVPESQQDFLPANVAEPDTLVREHLEVSVGGLDIELHHARGETDDHLWAWMPSKRAACIGDLLIWNFPNAGNPQKVQRYPYEWAQALRGILAKEPELLLPAHGLPIAGRDRIARVLTDVAEVLEQLVADTVRLMNDGASLDTILHSVSVPDSTLARPYLRPLYDEPEFVVRNIWRLYGGWYDGNPARLKPAPDATVAAEVAALAGGPTELANRAEALAANGDFRLACQLIEWATDAAPSDTGLHQTRAVIYRARRDSETSTMAKGIFTVEVRRSEQQATTA